MSEAATLPGAATRPAAREDLHRAPKWQAEKKSDCKGAQRRESGMRKVPVPAMRNDNHGCTKSEDNAANRNGSRMHEQGGGCDETKKNDCATARLLG